MSRYSSTVSGSWNEKLRLIRFRRKKEHLRLAEEIKLVPRGILVAMGLLLVIGELIALTLCQHNIPEPWPMVLEYGEKAGMALVAAIGLGIWMMVAGISFLSAYVYVDAKRRSMNASLWLFLVLIMLPAYLGVGFVLYFTAREPLPYHCPNCGSMVSARFNYCPGCKYALHPTCAQCQQEVGEMDKYCPHCGNDVALTRTLESA
jgi:hypothetical protein